MKKTIALILAFALVLSVCGCSGETPVPTTTEGTTQSTTQTTAPEQAGLQVGYARADITPVETVPLGGFGSTSNRMASTVLEPIFATCTAVTGANGATVLLIATDLIRSSSKWVDIVRPMIGRETGVPEENIYISSSHTHAGPDLDNSGEESIVTYFSQLCLLLREIAVAAMLDRAPAKMYYGSIETEYMNFVRHYKHTAADGTVKYFGDNFGTAVIDETTAHATQVDPTMHVIRFTRETGKDVVMVNWRAHPCLHSGSTRYDLSSDYVGSFRTALELLVDCNFIYFQGAAGNLNATSRITDEMRTRDNNEFGALLAEYAAQCLASNMTEAEGSDVQTRQTILTAPVDHSQDHLYSVAAQLKSNFKSNEYGIRSVYHAGAIITKCGMGETLDLELNVATIGDSVAFVTAPNELFDTNSVYLEDNSPYPMNFTLELSNGHEGYVPSAEGYAYTCYESDVTKVAAGTGELIQDTFLGMLRQIADSTAPAVTPAVVTGTLTQEPAQNVKLYWNVYRQEYAPGGKVDNSTRLRDEDGYYSVVFAVDGKQETLRVKDKKLIDIIDFNDITGLVLDESGLVTDVLVLRQCTGGFAANRSYVRQVDGNTVTCNTAAGQGVEFQLELTAATQVYNVSQTDETCGNVDTLRPGDQITALWDADGNVSHVYIVRRVECVLDHTDHCICGGAAVGIQEDCQAQTQWIAWGDDPTEWDTLPTQSGCYYLACDVVLAKRHEIAADADITICLNGKSISSSADRLLGVYGTLNICDCRFTESQGVYTYTGSVTMGYTKNSAQGGAFYVYDGAVLNLYSGQITGAGTLKNGGLIYTKAGSTTNIYNATVTGGASYNNGGNIFVEDGTVNIYGGVVTAGKAPTAGSGIYIKKGVLNISGSPKITDNNKTDIYLCSGQYITVGQDGLTDGAAIGIVLETGTGIFAANAAKSDQKYFTAEGAAVSWDPETKQLTLAG